MAAITYTVIEGSTESEDDIKSCIETLTHTLKQFSPKKVTISVQETLPEYGAGSPNTTGYT